MLTLTPLVILMGSLLASIWIACQEENR